MSKPNKLENNPFVIVSGRKIRLHVFEEKWSTYTNTETGEKFKMKKAFMSVKTMKHRIKERIEEFSKAKGNYNNEQQAFIEHLKNRRGGVMRAAFKAAGFI